MIKVVLILILLAGVGFCIEAAYTPYFSDEIAKYRLDDEALRSDVSSKKFRDHYYNEVAKLKTGKTQMMDLGAGLIIASLSLLVFCVIFKIKNLSDIGNFRSISRPLILILSPFIWLLMIPGTYWYYYFRLQRGDYPWFADSTAIPVMENITIVIVGLVILIPFLLITTRRYQHPTRLKITSSIYDVKAIMTEMLWGLLLLVNLICFYNFIVDGDHLSIIVNVYFTYLIMALRAGSIHYKNKSLKPALNCLISN